MRLSYYRTDVDSFAKTFCGISEKCYYSNKKTQVITLNACYVTTLDQVLWSYSKKHFIPHATLNDPYPELQPILIVDSFHLKYNPEILLTVNMVSNNLEVLFKQLLEAREHKVGRVIILEDEVAGIGIGHLTKVVEKNKSFIQQFEKFQLINGEWKSI